MEKLNLEKQQQASEAAVFERNYLDTAQFLDVLVHSSELVRVFARSKNQSKEKSEQSRLLSVLAGTYVVNLLLTIGLIG